MIRILHTLKIVAAVICLSVSSIVLSDPSPMAQVSLEHKVKSAYLFKISQFIYWPERASKNDADNKVHLCIVGEDIFSVAQTFQSELGFDVENVELIKTTSSSLSETTCNVIYLAASEFITPIKNTLSNVDKNVITISDKKGFAEDGGMIELSTRTGTIHMLINMQAVELSSVKLSAMLLEVAELEW